jgi:hypothetical protein
VQKRLLESGIIDVVCATFQPPAHEGTGGAGCESWGSDALKSGWLVRQRWLLRPVRVGSASERDADAQTESFRCVVEGVLTMLSCLFDNLIYSDHERHVSSPAFSSHT